MQVNYNWAPGFYTEWETKNQTNKLNFIYHFISHLVIPVNQLSLSDLSGS